MQQFLIEGGIPLSGEVTPGGNKNAILKMLPACLLTDEPVIIHNVPGIADVKVTLELMQQLGVKVEWIGEKSLRIHAENVKTSQLDPALSQKIRTSFVFAGPMLARCGKISLPSPGGDAIGERRLDTHVNGLRKLGTNVRYERGNFEMDTAGLKGADILLSEASVTATDNIVMAAVLAKGTTILRNAAGEPHVQNLCNMLNTLGAKIEGIGSNRLVIEGVERLHGGETRCGADYMEVGSWIGAAVVTGGELRIKDADPEYLDMVAQVFARLGVEWQVERQDILVSAHQSLVITPDIGNRIPIIKAQPWPAFPADLMSIALIIATQSAGAVMFHDWMFESRLFFTDKLVRMGARIILCDPHRVLVQGPTALKGSPNITSPDIRAGMALVLAALAAKGETRISNIGQIDRGYERVEEKLLKLGAKIERVAVNALDTVEVEQVRG
ncbi:MAG TPA: UDP-N-acetylglucosamine 1-carboxyvinyltransferase [Phototrophicaceae bacterium]|jgi:UDP-N-acetylglucosamine 1-carboxyvinyltransferase|nr:UDP-N-acetylglucosamine 1-carboxyvinyltransferase [Phototrophicaceae bacterium]